MANTADSIGDQHKPYGTTTANPFEDGPPRLSEYTAQEIATLQSRLDKQLGPEYISSRPGAAGQKVHYLAAEKVINLANEVFGFNGWSSGIQNIQVDFVDEHAQTGKISLGLSVIVRVTLKDGSFHEDIGYGHIENCKGKAAAFEKAKKEGTTDGLKRALRTFGNVLGNCIYDKEFVAKVTKVKVAPSKWDVDNLHRHADYAPAAKKEIVHEAEDVKIDRGSGSHTETEDDFGIADFDDADFSEGHAGHPDEVTLPTNGVPPITHGMNTPSRPPNAREYSVQNHSTSTTNGPWGPNQQQRMALPPNNAVPLQSNQNKPASGTHQQQKSSNTDHSSSPGVPSEHFAPQPLPTNAQTTPSVGFYSARAAAHIATEGPTAVALPANIPKFDPHAESPSIRKTAGIDHKRSVPVKRGPMPTAVPPLTRDVPSPAGPAVRDFVNPSADMHRRIGAPGAMQSPAAKGGMNASAYRPPTRRGPDAAGPAAGVGVGQTTGAAKRPPLGDVSNMQQANTGAGGDGDVKRLRLSGRESGLQGNNVTGAR